MKSIFSPLTWQFIGFLPLCFIFVLALTDNAQAAKTGLSTEWIKVNGNIRRYLIYRPKGIQQNRKVERSLVFVIHGDGGTDQGMIDLSKSRWNQLAELHKHYVVYPNAMEHYWPNGFQPKAFAPKQAPKAIMNRNVSNKDIWDFLSAHRISIE